jgi:hypothetical protein
MESSTMLSNASIHNRRHPGEWALSVGCAEGWTAAEIAMEARFIQNRQIRTSTVGAVRALGHDVRLSGRPPHADLHLRTMPSEPLFDALRAAFNEAEPNPRFE